MLYAKISRSNGKWIEENVYLNYEELHKDTFNPTSNVELVLPFCIHGKTYSERKANAEQLAVEFQRKTCEETDIRLSYREFFLVQSFFEKIGKRYGLLSEFRENGIC